MEIFYAALFRIGNYFETVTPFQKDSNGELRGLRLSFDVRTETVEGEARQVVYARFQEREYAGEGQLRDNSPIGDYLYELPLSLIEYENPSSGNTTLNIVAFSLFIASGPFFVLANNL